MIAELPGRAIRRWALIREAVRKQVSRPPSAAYTLESLSADYRNRLADRSLAWPPASQPPKGKALILVSPWLATPVPYYSMELGRALASTALEVEYLWDPENVFFNRPRPREIKAIEEALAVLGKDFRILSLPDAEAAVGSQYDQKLQEIVSENAVRFGGGESHATHERLSWETNAAAVKRQLARILHLLRETKPDFLVIPGGVFGGSALYSLACRALGISFTTYDCGSGAVVFAHDSAAAHLENVGQAYHDLRPELSRDDISTMIGQTESVLSKRRAGTDVFRLQPPSSGHEQTGGYDLFVPLNFRTDTAALQRQKLFSSVRDWLDQLLEWVASQPGVSIVIRQHPCERIPEYRGTDDWPAFLKPFRSKLGSRLRFVSAWDRVNSYDLIASAKVALPYTSRTGIECAYLGVPTILCSKCFYGGADFVRAPETSTDYFAAIRAALDGQIRLDEGQRTNAGIFYNLVETTSLCASIFTPMPEDFARWVKMSPSDLVEHQSLGLILECLHGRHLFPTLLYQRQSKALQSS